MSGMSIRAVVLAGAGKLNIEQVPLPESGPGQVRVRLPRVAGWSHG